MDNGLVAHASTTVEAPISAVWDALVNNNATEQTREHSEKNWNMMLAGMKKVVEQRKSGYSGREKPPRRYRSLTRSERDRREAIMHNVL